MTDVLVRILAVVGGGMGGGFGLDLLTRLLMRVLTIRTPPRWSLLTVRLLGCVICGWLVALWLFPGEGTGRGNGWFGIGRDAGEGDGKRAEEIETKDKDGKSSDSAKKKQDSESLRIVVRDDSPPTKQDSQEERWYGIENDERQEALTLSDLAEVVKKWLEEQPPMRRIEIIYSARSPDIRVRKLEAWAVNQNDGKIVNRSEGKITVDFPPLRSDAPRK